MFCRRGHPAMKVQGTCARSKLGTARICAASLLVLACAISRHAMAVDDVLLQIADGQIVTGIIDDNSLAASLGARVFRQQFLSNFRSANPGFFSLATGDPGTPAGAQGFPSNHDVRFDLLPIT